jgi:hypothetical protein
VTAHTYNHSTATCIHCGISHQKALDTRRYECRLTNRPSTITIKALRRLIRSNK